MKVKQRHLLGGVGLAALLLVTALLFVIPPPVGSSDYAAWVQGIGTIAAVGVTAWVGLAPVRNDQAAKAEARETMRNAIIEVTDLAERLGITVREAATNRDYLAARQAMRGLWLSGLEDLIESLLAESRAVWPSEKLRISVNMMRMYLVRNREGETKKFPLDPSRLRPEDLAGFWELVDATAKLINVQVTVLRIQTEEAQKP